MNEQEEGNGADKGEIEEYKMRNTSQKLESGKTLET